MGIAKRLYEIYGPVAPTGSVPRTKTSPCSMTFSGKASPATASLLRTANTLVSALSITKRPAYDVLTTTSAPSAPAA
ncbi:hypothetical protein PENARI_c007G10351 [Penicillium arizonense]|uniref:Uncharacterized protein n=1 Tax=Penicillium arizonense TaxID=1835702 RepID=A0A1F5LL81_PENAI|nr:hypothetical protein PENARI_c007G10351 [Penicillium arizonense]OGE53964.1 hypothetical protein PENARI_c007G10351 [Penicillium arizonense]